MPADLFIDARMWYHSGIGTYLQNLVPALARRFATRVLVPAPILHLPGEQFVCRTPIYAPREQLDVALRADACRLYWSPHYNMTALPLRTARRLVTVHDVFHLAHAHTLSPARRAYARLLIGHAVRRADRVVTVSRFSRDEIAHHTGIAPGRVTVIHNGVDAARFQNPLGPVVPGLPAGPYVLYVGNVKPHKNVLGLLEAFRQLTARAGFDDLHLVLVGNYAGLRTSVDDLPARIAAAGLRDRVHTPGRVDDAALPEFYRRAAAFAFPTFYEGFGLPPLEAMAAGCPAVVSRTGPLPEICGPAARYVNPEDPGDIADGLGEVLHDADRRRALVAAGRRRVASFTWARAADAHARLIEELL
ncbi:MAG: glycosyltransferase family 1 protein [Catalinimonas sp.]